MEYRVINKTVKGKRSLYPVSISVYDVIDDPNVDHYSSIFIYNDEHKKILETKGSLAGIKDVHTDLLAFDLDSSSDLENARKDTIVLCDRLIDRGINQNDINVCFSGSKGFSVTVTTDKLFTLEEFKAIHSKLTDGLETSDTTIRDNQRIFRIAGTKHQGSGLYKFPITVKELKEFSIADIMDAAKDIGNTNIDYKKPAKKVSLPEYIYNLKNLKKEHVAPKVITDANELDFNKKPKGFTNCKFAILEGFFPTGNRNNALMSLVATCKANGYNKEIAYNMAKASIRLQANRYNQEPFSTDELWVNIVEQVYRPTWEGGQFTCKKEGWLKDFCQSLGKHTCKHNDTEFATVQTTDVCNLFENYAKNYDQNVLTTGIKPLDEKAKFMVGTSGSILAPPGVGKTSLSLNILNHNSKKKVPSIFFSYDMTSPMVYLRLIQKHTGLNQDKVFDIYKHNPKELSKINELINEEYKHVNFCFKSGQTPDELEQTIVETEQQIGEKIKLAIVDYNELVIASTSDPTQASAQVAQRIRQISNDHQVATITLLQPSKLYSNPGDEAQTYQAAKGSGAIAQSMTLMLALSRPGFSVRNPEQDRFMSVSALKNRNGGLFAVDMGWDGLTGSITELSDEDQHELSMIRDKRQLEKAESSYG